MAVTAAPDASQSDSPLRLDSWLESRPGPLWRQIAPPKPGPIDLVHDLVYREGGGMTWTPR